MSPAPRTPMPDLSYLPATELALRLRRREISSLALLEHSARVKGERPAAPP